MAKAKKKESLSLEEKLEQALVPINEQPYELPDNWCWIKAGTLFLHQHGFAFKSKDYIEKSDVLNCRMSNIRPDGKFDCEYKKAYLPNEYYEKYRDYIVKDGDVIVALTDMASENPKILGLPTIVYTNGYKMLLNQRVLKIVPYDDRTKKYINYVLHHMCITQFRNKLKGSGSLQINLKTDDITGLSIPLPPINEQQRIVEQIESLFAKLDEAKDKIQEVLSGYQYRKTMIIHNAFAGNYTKAWREKKDYSIDDWKHLTLNDVAEYKKGPFGSSITKAMFVPKSSNTYKVYEQGNAIRKTIDYGSYYITEEKYQELKGFAVQAGDIIISCAGTIGEVYKLPEDCEAGVINQALMRVRTFDNVDEKFFIYYFGEVLKGDVNEQANGTAIKNIPPFKIMKAMEIELPTLEEQREIVALLDKVLDSEKQSEDALNVMIEQIQLMKKSILAKAFRGELGTNNPDEESAVELLKSILATE